jgi:hypothetical protein
VRRPRGDADGDDDEDDEPALSPRDLEFPRGEREAAPDLEEPLPPEEDNGDGDDNDDGGGKADNDADIINDDEEESNGLDLASRDVREACPMAATAESTACGTAGLALAPRGER